MKIIRFKHNEKIEYGEYDFDKGSIITIKNPISTFPKIEYLHTKYNYSDVEILNLSDNPVIVCVGSNYKTEDQVKSNDPMSLSPVIYLKSQNSILKPHGTIVAKNDMGAITANGGIAIVIGKDAHAVSSIDAPNYILGYTSLNDITVHTAEKKDNAWIRTKSFDTFTPYGEWLETDVSDPHNLTIQTTINGEVVHESNTQNLVHCIMELVGFVSLMMPLKAGDMIFTGSTGDDIILSSGDHVSVSIPNVCTLSNKFVQVD